MTKETPKDEYTILIVDDSAFFKNHLNKLLSDEGYKVVGVSSSAQEALNLIKEKKPNLVISDVVMPQMSGIDLAKKSFELDLGSAFILMSSLSHEQIVLEAISAGASDFLQKPIQENQLFDSIEKIRNQARD